MYVCVCVRIRQSLSLQGLQTLSLYLSSPASFTLPSVRAVDGRGRRGKTIGGERQFWRLQISDCPEFSPCLLLCLHSCRTFFLSLDDSLYVCVCLSLLLSLSVSVSLFHSLNSELQEHRDCVQFDQCPLSLPVSRIPLSFW